MKVKGVPKVHNLYDIAPYFNLEYCLYTKKHDFQPKIWKFLKKCPLWPNKSNTFDLKGMSFGCKTPKYQKFKTTGFWVNYLILIAPFFSVA